MERRTAISRGVLATAGAVVLLLAVAYGSSPPAAMAQCGGGIGFWAQVAGEIPYGGASCPYTFFGSEGDTVTINMVRQEPSLDPLLVLVDPGGAVVASDDDSGGDRNSLLSYRLPGSGTYTIIAGSYGNGSAGRFILQLGGGCGGNMPANQWVSGRIPAPGQRCEFTFPGNAGEFVSIALQSGSFDSWLDLRDPYGRIVVSDDDSYGNRNSLINSYRLGETGPYTIIVRSYNDSGAGDFGVYLRK
jgi:hypothetical protein